jgi:hypothetical protein
MPAPGLEGDAAASAFNAIRERIRKNAIVFPKEEFCAIY